MLNLTTMAREFNRNKKLCVIALKGKIKGETSERDHIFPCCHATRSGISILFWIKSLILAHKCMNRSGGAAITSKHGKILSVSALDSSLHVYLMRLWHNGDKFPVEIKGEEDI